MAIEEEKKREVLKRNVKIVKRQFNAICTQNCLMIGLGSTLVIASLVWILNIFHFTYRKQSDINVFAVNLDDFEINVQRNVEGKLRGDADQEWLSLPRKGDPVEFQSHWEIPKEYKPLEILTRPMKRLDDSTSNYPGSSPERMHGIYGKRPDGKSHPWESKLKRPLDREYPDFRGSFCKNAPFYEESVVAKMPAVSVVFIFSNEKWEMLMRSVHSVLNTTPPHLLYEIILVDDGSTWDEYAPNGNRQLLDYIECCLPPKVKFTRTNTRAGIPKARISGINLAKSDIFVILDSHIECSPGWLEPLVYKIQQDPTSFTMPMIDSIKKETLEATGGGVGCSLGLIWKVMEHSLTPDPNLSPDHRILKDPWGYVSSPSMSGGLFAGSKKTFFDLGAYDIGMEGWGAENVEFGIRVWQCGGKIQCSQCSRVGHIFGNGQNYSQKGGEARLNRLRTAATWMDEFGILPRKFNGMTEWHRMGDISDRMKLRHDMQCHDFKWFLDNVWPESSVRRLPEDLPYYGQLRHKASGSCTYSTHRAQKLKAGNNCDDLLYYSRIKAIGSGADDESYLSVLTFDWPHENDKNQRYDIKIVNEGVEKDDVKIVHIATGKCMALPSNPSRGIEVQLVRCDDESVDQVWSWDKLILSNESYYTLGNYSQK